MLNTVNIDNFGNIDRRDFLGCLAVALGTSSLFSFDSFADPVFQRVDYVGKVCVIFDDAGGAKESVTNLEFLAREEVSVTIALMPRSRYEQDILDALVKYEKAPIDLIIHQQMEFIGMGQKGRPASMLEVNPREPGEKFDPEKHAAIIDSDSATDAQKILSYNIRRIDDYLVSSGSSRRVIGFNNHTGSLLTQKVDVMEALGRYAADNNLVVVDSVTIASSVMYEEARKAGAKAYKRNIDFIDSDHGNKKSSILKLSDCYGKAMMGFNVLAIGHLQNAETVREYIKAVRRDKGYFRRLTKF